MAPERPKRSGGFERISAHDEDGVRGTGEASVAPERPKRSGGFERISAHDEDGVRGVGATGIEPVTSAV